jgi:hypothetical protein
MFSSGSPVTEWSNPADYGYVVNQTVGMGYDNGARFVLNYGVPLSGSDYHLRVSSRYPNRQGNFYLKWDVWQPNYLGPCDECPPSVSAGETCLSSLHLNDVNTSQSSSFTWSGSAILPVGLYVIRYCHGWYTDASWIITGGGCGVDGVDPCCGPMGYYTTDEKVAFTYPINPQGSQSVVTFPFPHKSTVSSYAVTNASTCEQIMIPLNRTGSIQMDYDKSSWPTQCLADPSEGGCPIPISGPNEETRLEACNFGGSLPTSTINGIYPANGTPNPTFGLYSVAPALKIIGSNGNTRTSCGTSYTASFNIQNLGNVSWQTCSIQTINTGEVTGASTTPQATFDIPSYGGVITTPSMLFQRTNTTNNAFTMSFNFYIASYNNTSLASLGMSPLTTSLFYTMNPTFAKGFVENGASGFSRSGDNISCSFKVNYTGITSGDFWACGYYTASLRPNVNVSNVPAPSSVFNSQTTAQTIPMSFTIAPTGETRAICLIDIQNPTGAIVKTLSYDLTPVISVTASPGSPTSLPCGYTASPWKITYTNIGIGSTNALSLTTSASQCIGVNYPQTGLQIAGSGGSVTFGCNTGGGCTAFIQEPFSINMVDGPFVHTPFFQA